MFSKYFEKHVQNSTSIKKHNLKTFLKAYNPKILQTISLKVCNDTWQTRFKLLIVTNFTITAKPENFLLKFDMQISILFYKIFNIFYIIEYTQHFQRLVLNYNKG